MMNQFTDAYMRHHVSVCKTNIRKKRCYNKKAKTTPLHVSVMGHNKATQIAKFMGPTWGPPGSCRPQMGPMLTPWTLLSGYASFVFSPVCPFWDHTVVWYRGAEQGTDKCFVIIHHSHASVTQGRVSFLMMSHVNPVKQNCGKPHE